MRLQHEHPVSLSLLSSLLLLYCKPCKLAACASSCDSMRRCGKPCAAAAGRQVRLHAQAPRVSPPLTTSPPPLPDLPARSNINN